MDTLKLNETISFYRKRIGMTQEGLAQAIGVTNQSVSKWEASQCCPDIALIPKLADVFGITIDQLFGKKSNEKDANIEFPFYDDDVFRVVVARGRKIITVDDMESLNVSKPIDITFPKNCNETTRQYFKVEVFGSVLCDASINGDVVSHGKIECNEINGDIKECQDSILCKGDVRGGVSAGSDVFCGGSITGAVFCGHSLTCDGTINGSVSCEHTVACDNIVGNVTSGGNISCKYIEGDVECQGDIIRQE